MVVENRSHYTIKEITASAAVTSNIGHGVLTIKFETSIRGIIIWINGIKIELATRASGSVYNDAARRLRIYAVAIACQHFQRCLNGVTETATCRPIRKFPHTCGSQAADAFIETVVLNIRANETPYVTVQIKPTTVTTFIVTQVVVIRWITY